MPMQPRRPSAPRHRMPKPTLTRDERNFLTVPEQNQLLVARRALRTNPAIQGVMGSMTMEDARATVKAAKENIRSRKGTRRPARNLSPIERRIFRAGEELGRI